MVWSPSPHSVSLFKRAFEVLEVGAWEKCNKILRKLKTQILLTNFRRSEIWQKLKKPHSIKINYFTENTLSKLYSSNLKLPIFQVEGIRNSKEERERQKIKIQLVSWILVWFQLP